MGVERFNLVKKHKAFGCRVCEHNPMGMCELASRDVPVGYVLMNGHPRWCPKGKKDERKKHV